MTGLPGLNYVELNVAGLQQSVRWYTRLFGRDPQYHHWDAGDPDAESYSQIEAEFVLDDGTEVVLRKLQADRHYEGDIDAPVKLPADAAAIALPVAGIACADVDEFESWKRHLNAIEIPYFERRAGGRRTLSIRDRDDVEWRIFAPRPE